MRPKSAKGCEPRTESCHTTMTPQTVCAGRYRHFKGKYYDVIGVAADTETGTQYVVYTSEEDRGRLWVRPLEMFVESIHHDGNLVSRFRLVDLPGPLADAF
jgi:hypothetical protein